MSRRRTNRHSASLSLTPMIDVMTVLLAVFMVTTPLMTAGIDLDLPNAGKTVISGADHSVQISVDKSGNYYLGKTKMSRDNVIKKVIAMRNENSDLSIMINGDRKSDYGAVMSVMGGLKAAGFQKVGLRTKLEN